MGKRLPQLYYIKVKISYDLGFIVRERIQISASGHTDADQYYWAPIFSDSVEGQFYRYRMKQNRQGVASLYRAN